MSYQTSKSETIQQKVIRQNGFINVVEDLPKIIELDRLTPILVRCGGKRFTAPAQDVESLIDLVSRDGEDYVRDAAITADTFTRWKWL